MAYNRKGFTELAEGKTDSLKVSRSFGTVTGEEVDALCALIKESPHLKRLELETPDITPPQLERILDHLAGSGVENFAIRNTTLTDASIASLADLMGKLPKLDKVNFSSNLLVAESGIAPVMDTLRESGVPLKTLNLYNTILTLKDTESVAELLKQSPKLEDLNLDYCELGGDSKAMEAIANALPHCRNLRSLALEEPNDTLIEHLSAKTNPNLFNAHTYTTKINRLSIENRDSAIRRFSPLAEAEHGLGSAHLRDIAACAEVLPLLEHLSYSQESPVPRERFLQLKAYLDNPPAIPDTLAALTTPDETGRAPLEHPATWQQIGSILETQEKNGTPLDKAFLLSGNGKGESWLEIGLASATASVVQELNNRHIRINPSELMRKNADGQNVPSPLLEAAIANDHPEALFTAENLHGASSGDVSRLFAALPEESQARIPNINTLIQQVRASSATLRGVGR